MDSLLLGGADALFKHTNKAWSNVERKSLEFLAEDLLIYTEEMFEADLFLNKIEENLRFMAFAPLKENLTTFCFEMEMEKEKFPFTITTFTSFLANKETREEIG